MKPCPTCGATGSNPCIRGRMFSPIWKRNEALGTSHDSRVTANTATEGEIR